MGDVELKGTQQSFFQGRCQMVRGWQGDFENYLSWGDESLDGRDGFQVVLDVGFC